MTRYFHRTSSAAAEAILAQGFRNGRGTYLTDTEFEGVWLSEDPGLGTAAEGAVLLAVELPAHSVEPYEVVEEGKPYREFLVPAAVVNAGTVTLINEEHDDD